MSEAEGDLADRRRGSNVAAQAEVEVMWPQVKKVGEAESRLSCTAYLGCVALSTP